MKSIINNFLDDTVCFMEDWNSSNDSMYGIMISVVCLEKRFFVFVFVFVKKLANDRWQIEMEDTIR